MQPLANFGGDYWAVVAQVNVVLTLAAAIEFRAAFSKIRWPHARLLPPLCFAVSAACFIFLNLIFLIEAVHMVGLVGTTTVTALGDDSYFPVPLAFPLVTFSVAFLASTVATVVNRSAKPGTH